MSLILSNLKKAYGEHVIFDVDHFQFEQGAFWIQGINGAGKTTLLKTIAGMLPFDGEVSWEKFYLKKHRQNYLQQVSYAAAEPLYPDFVSGTELIDFYIECRNADATEVKKILAETGVEKFSDGKVGTYSSGMVKKLSLALAFIGKPSVLLLDEPLITIDKESLHIFYELMRNFLNHQQGVLLFTSHQAPAEAVLPGLKKINLLDGNLIIE